MTLHNIYKWSLVLSVVAQGFNTQDTVSWNKEKFHKKADMKNYQAVL